MKKDVNISPEELNAGFEAAGRLMAEHGGRGLKYHIETYGCQMNEHDSEKLAGMLERCGFTPAKEKGEADIVIFNTCCVRDHAEKRVFGNIGALKAAKEERPSLIIGVCGCMMQQREVADKLYKRFPFVDLIFGTHELHRFPLLLERVMAGERVLSVSDSDGGIAEGLPVARAGGVSSFVTIMYGCNNFCSYCIVPYVRGRERSRRPADIIDEIRELSQSGCREVTLLGQNVNSYSSGDTDFPALLRLVNDSCDISRIRFMTSHPKDLSPGLIDAMAGLERVCHHIHLPVQSGSDAVLARMNRRYDRRRYFAITDALRSAVKDVEITTDIIVGFPGETEEDFDATLDLVSRVRFSAAYTFMYSPRAGTAAASMPSQVSEEVKHERLMRLNERIGSILRKENEAYIGRRGTVLVEGADDRGEPMAFGKLGNFKMVYFPGGSELIGSMREVEIRSTKTNSLIGELTKGS